MNEIHPCPVDHGRFFDDENPESVMARSYQLSTDLRSVDYRRSGNPEALLNECTEDLSSCFPNLDPYSRDHRVASMVRGAVARVVGLKLSNYTLRMGMNLLNGDDYHAQKALQNPGFSLVEHPDAVLQTDYFNRVWHGDDARLIALTGLILQQALDEAIRTIPPLLSQTFQIACERVTVTAGRIVAHRGISEQVEQNAWKLNSAERKHWLQAHIAKQAIAPSLNKPEAFLTHQIETNTEHISALMLDILHGFTCSPWSTERMDTDGFIRTFIAHSHLSPTAAFMSNRIGAEAEYKDRYVKSTTPHRGHYGSLRDPMAFVIPSLKEGFYNIFPNPLSAFANTSRLMRNRCPGPDALPPLGIAEVGFMSYFQGALLAKTEGYDSAISKRLVRNHGLIDGIALVNACIASFLVREGLATFGPDEVARHLKTPGEATSTGAFKIERPAPAILPIKSRTPTIHFKAA